MLQKSLAGRDPSVGRALIDQSAESAEETNAGVLCSCIGEKH